MLRLKQRVYNYFFFLLSSLVLASCGGGGDPSVPDNLDELGLTSVTLTIALANNSTTSPELSQTQDNFVNVTVVDQSGNPIVGEIVTLATTLGTVSGNGQGLTNSNGTAVFEIELTGALAGNGGTLTASYANDQFNIAAEAELDVQAGAPADTDGSVPFVFTIGIELQESGTELRPSAEGDALLITLTSDSGTVAGQLLVVETSIGTLTPGSDIVTDASGVNNLVNINTQGINTGTAVQITVTHLESGVVETVIFEVGDQTTTQPTPGNPDATPKEICLVAGLFDQLNYDINPDDAAPIDRINPVQPGTIEIVVKLVNEGTCDNSQERTITTLDPVTLPDGEVTRGQLPQPNAIVSLSQPTVGLLSVASGQIITNDDSIATVDLFSGDATSGEGGTITITVGSVSKSLTFGIGSADIDIGSQNSAGTHENGILKIEQSSIGSSGNTSVSVDVVDQSGEKFDLRPVEIQFTSPCTEAGLATLESPVTTKDGTATSSYTATGCAGNDTIIATIVDIEGPRATGNIEITGSIPNSIAFNEADPPTIALKGTGGNERVETSDVEFQIVDNTGEPESGVIVNFALSTSVGGISLVADTAFSNAEGTVTATVSSGNIPTPVRVIATVSLIGGVSVSDANNDSIVDGSSETVETTISTVSDQLIISTGLPDQRSFSLSADKINVGGGSVDGVTTNVTVRAADAFNNPVPDGTAINFTTEYGAIGPSCTTANGLCLVEWRSQSARSQINYTADNIVDDECDNPDGISTTKTRGMPCRDSKFAIPHGAYSRVLAYAIGEETFVDSNGNGAYDAEPFEDANDNEEYDEGEEFTDTNGNGIFDFEVFEDIAEAFVDHNDSGDFNNPFTVGSCAHPDSTDNCNVNINLGVVPPGGEEETFVDFNSDQKYTKANGVYNGSLCSESSELAMTCTRELVNVYDSLNLVMSSNIPYFSVYRDTTLLTSTTNINSPPPLNNPPEIAVETIDVRNQGSDLIRVYISDEHNGPLPGGTSVAITNTNCDVTSTRDFEFTDTATTMMSFGISIVDDEQAEGGSGEIIITVSVPPENGGIETVFEIPCIDQ